jgi:putative heme-binding domain-containing protein
VQTITCAACLLGMMLLLSDPGIAQTLRHPLSLEKQLQQTDVDDLVDAVRMRGNPARGAVLFYKSPAACVNCHASGEGDSPLGPNLAELGKVSDQHVIESLLFPSKSVRPGFETYSVLTVDGQVMTGMLVSQNDTRVVMRSASNLNKPVTIDRDQIETIRKSDQSMMPNGLVASLPEQRDFLDLVAYVIEVAAGGTARAQSLKPSAELLAIQDDTVDLDHAGILKSLKGRDFEAGRSIFHGYCFNCHGNDGNTPSLPTARAFGTQALRFGSDPYRMFLTLSKGNGLMAPMTHLTPKERYQVVHYIREQFMRPTNPAYFEVDQGYLDGLPKGSRSGDEIEFVARDYGPALGSQLERTFSSVLSVQLESVTLSYNLHRMDQAGIWRGGFLDLSETQHQRDRGEGTAEPDGEVISGLAGWRWGHEGKLDDATENLLPRGPMPRDWMDYYGYYLHGDTVALSYSIDGRKILESPSAKRSAEQTTVTHAFELGPGKPLRLCVAEVDEALPLASPYEAWIAPGQTGAATGRVAMILSGDQDHPSFTSAGVRGDIDGMVWSVDQQGRIVLQIPGGEQTRVFQVIRTTGRGTDALNAFATSILAQQAGEVASPRQITVGGPTRWPDEITTIGTLGLSKQGYALDTLTLPDSTPWNTWFRTSSLDFFSDGRMVVTTYGGDVWVVSGVDDSLLNLQWKRFAGGLYEPFGVKVVDDQIYVTCKDRITRLHDHNHDGEADFYESFSADTDVSVNFHAFNFDLQVDDDGNFYYAKSGHGGDSDIPGCVIKVSADGKQREVYCTGFRTPNGMGMLPGNRPTASDNQGQWTPASKVSQLRPGGFYGWVQTYSIPGKWAPGGGTIDINKVVPPKTFDRPLVWMPQDFDNSSGGQLWVDDARWGPLSGRLLHTSFGKGWMYYLMMQEFDGLSQAAIIKLPFDFRTGIMRARINPADGQVYATGLQGWNGGGRIGLQDGGIQRLRYTGIPPKLVTDCKVESGGLRITFNFPLDPDAATAIDAFVAKHWNYHWRREYGSEQYSPITDQVGAEKMNVESVTLGADGKSVKLMIPDLIPVDQVHLILRVQSSDGEAFEEEIYWTLNRVR